MTAAVTVSLVVIVVGVADGILRCRRREAAALPARSHPAADPA